MEKKLENLKINIFADGANINEIRKMYDNPLIKGFTTNPSLMKKAGVKNYKNFIQDVINIVKDKPISFEVFADDDDKIEIQGRKIASIAKNIYIKIPITNTKKKFTGKVIKNLLASNIPLNITAITTLDQIKMVYDLVNCDTPIIFSIFAGRIADTGVDPINLINQSIKITNDKKNIQILWASTREILNIVQADRTGCHIITVPNDLLKKLSLIGKNLEGYSLETVKGFYDDALSSGFKI